MTFFLIFLQLKHVFVHVFVDDHTSIFSKDMLTLFIWFSKESDAKMSCNDLETSSTSKTAHLLISIVLSSTFLANLVNFGMAVFVSTITNKQCVGFGSNREELKEKHTEKKKVEHR